MTKDKLLNISNLVLRLGVGTVFLLFGVDKLLSPEQWIIYIEGGMVRWILEVFHLNPNQFLSIQGGVEFLLGFLLILGIGTRVLAGICAVLLGAIVFELGYDPIAIRDFGLISPLIALILIGPGDWSLDEAFKQFKRNAQDTPQWFIVLPWVLLGVCLLALIISWMPKNDSEPVKHRVKAKAKVVKLVSSSLSSKLRREPVFPIPDIEPLDEDRVALGRALFHDTRLSKTNTISCASCHDLSKGGADGLAKSVGIHGLVGDINSPSVFNTRFHFKQFWDGRAEDLLEQVNGPVENHKEMGMSWPEVIVNLQQDADYVKRFKKTYEEGLTTDNVRDAIVTFEKSLVTPNSRFDLYLKGDDQAISAEEKEGYAIFKRIGCTVCHEGKLLGGNMFQTMGKMANYFEDRGNITEADYGRFNVTGNEEDRYKFKVPSLRNVELTAPYFHDGSAETLEEAVQVMSKYQLGLQLSQDEVDKIVLYLKTLTGEYEGQPL